MAARDRQDACFALITEAQDYELHIEGSRQFSQASGCQGSDADFGMSFLFSQIEGRFLDIKLAQLITT